MEAHHVSISDKLSCNEKTHTSIDYPKFTHPHLYSFQSLFSKDKD